MKIAINGMGIAGPVLAWWLKYYGHTPVLFERAPKVRRNGYMIDFWGIGYEVAEKMGILPDLEKSAYEMESLRLVDQNGDLENELEMATLRELSDKRFLNIRRGDVASTLCAKCSDIEQHFNCSIQHTSQNDHGVTVRLSDGTYRDFDLVVGADGRNSAIRASVFGPDEKFEKVLGAYVCTFILSNYEKRDDLVYLAHQLATRQAARISLRDDKTLFLFTFRAELVNGLSLENPKDILRHVYRHTQWEVPEILARLDDVEDFYFDRVSQIQMDDWSKGRVSLVGDAMACPSLCSGEGTGLAMTQAYVLAGELHRAKGDYRRAFERYQTVLEEFISRKQKSALKMVAFFAPKNEFQKNVSLPLVYKFFRERSRSSNFVLPEYEKYPS